jgi:hypothetical protein
MPEHKHPCLSLLLIFSPPCLCHLLTPSHHLPPLSLANTPYSFHISLPHPDLSTPCSYLHSLPSSPHTCLNIFFPCLPLLFPCLSAGPCWIPHLHLSFRCGCKHSYLSDIAIYGQFKCPDFGDSIFVCIMQYCVNSDFITVLGFVSKTPKCYY